MIEKMDEENKLVLSPSLQEFLVDSSQGNAIDGSSVTFNAVWDEHIKDMLSNIIPYGDPMLDSTAIDNQDNQQGTISVENAMHRDLRTNNHAVDSSVHLPPQNPTVGSNVYQGSSALPASETWPGEFEFTVSFSPQPKSTKGVSWTYSRIKDKLYVGKDVSCPVNISANTKLPDDTYIRVMALYSSPEQITEVVQRCINHSMEEINSGLIEAQHLIRCESSTATYHVDAITGRHSVVVPFENPSVGQQYSTYIYKFACFGSCSGGPNRRPLMLVFTLERGNQVIGRRKLDVKICACPGRDKKAEEVQYLEREPVSNHQRIIIPTKRKHASECALLSEVMEFTKSIYTPLPKKSKLAPNKDGLFVLNTEDIECYEFLKQMKKFFEICKIMKGVSPDVLSKALRQAQKVKSERND